LRISHRAFAVAFPCALYVACNALNIGRIARWFHGRDGLDLGGLSAYLFAGLCLFIASFALLAHRRTVKPLAVLLVAVSGAVTYFIAKYDVAVDTSMVRNVIHTDATEIDQLLSMQMVPYAVGLILVPLLVILSIEITFEERARYLIGSLQVASAALLLGVGTVYLQYNAIHRAGNVSNKYIVYSLVPVNVIAGSVGAVSRYVRPLVRARRAEASISGRVASSGNLVVVLAVGESSRRRNFSVYGYRRVDTTPALEHMTGLRLLNGVSRIGTTLYALPEILEQNGIKLATMTSRLGIQTACYVNYTLYDNCAAVGETMVRNCGHGGRCYDEDVVPLLDDNLRKYTSGYRLVILHLGGGSHGPRYADRYPPEFQRFQPTCNDADVMNRCTIEELYNAYDNSILYVDHVLGQVIGTLDRSRVPYVFLYLSDHGESLLEGGRMFHGMPPGVRLPAEQAEIPLIVKSSVPVSIVEHAEYRQPDVFDTVLDLFSIESPPFDRQRSFIRRLDAAMDGGGFGASPAAQPVASAARG
jgi:lipid A ethanolaminephosphotransferase